MKPRDFLNFFKTGSGKLVLFVVIFGGGLILFSVFRDRSKSGDMDVRVSGLTTNATDRPRWCRALSDPCNRSAHPHRSQSRKRCPSKRTRRRELLRTGRNRSPRRHARAHQSVRRCNRRRS